MVAHILSISFCCATGFIVTMLSRLNNGNLDMNNEAAVDDAKPRRTFRPFYKSTGDVMSDKLAFFHILEELKVHITGCHLSGSRD